MDHPEQGVYRSPLESAKVLAWSVWWGKGRWRGAKAKLKLASLGEFWQQETAIPTQVCIEQFQAEILEVIRAGTSSHVGRGGVPPRGIPQGAQAVWGGAGEHQHGGGGGLPDGTGPAAVGTPGPENDLARYHALHRAIGSGDCLGSRGGLRSHGTPNCPEGISGPQETVEARGEGGGDWGRDGFGGMGLAKEQSLGGAGSKFSGGLAGIERRASSGSTGQGSTGGGTTSTTQTRGGGRRSDGPDYQRREWVRRLAHWRSIIEYNKYWAWNDAMLRDANGGVKVDLQRWLAGMSEADSNRIVGRLTNTEAHLPTLCPIDEKERVVTVGGRRVDVAGRRRKWITVHVVKKDRARSFWQTKQRGTDGTKISGAFRQRSNSPAARNGGGGTPMGFTIHGIKRGWGPSKWSFSIPAGGGRGRCGIGSVKASVRVVPRGRCMPAD
eukprot:gene22919-biopygen5789